jgi:hypothetical protein
MTFPYGHISREVQQTQPSWGTWGI